MIAIYILPQKLSSFTDIYPNTQGNQDNEGDAEYTFFDKDGVKKVNIKKQKVSGNMEEKRVSNIIPFPRKNDLEVK